MLADRFITNDAELLKRAAEALLSGDTFECEVYRPKCAPEHQHQKWRGDVVGINRIGKGFQVEVHREDI